VLDGPADDVAAEDVEDHITRKGEIGAMLRREGPYTSHLTAWRKQRDAAALVGLAPRKRGPRGPRPEQVENEQLRRRAERAEAELLICTSR